VTEPRILQLGKTLQSRLKVFFNAPLDAGASPLEIVHAVLEQLDAKVQPVGRGQRVFPYNRVLVRMGPTATDRPALQAALDGLPGKFLERLGELRCPVPDGFELHVAHVKRPPADWQDGQLFAIECRVEAVEPAEVPAAPGHPTLHVTIVKGAASKKSYSFTHDVVSIGRTPEPTDDHGRVRRNDVVFLDTQDGITETVGRAHARLQYDPAAREYRIFNDGSRNPTFIARAGATIQLPPRDPRGVRVRSGDDIHLGRAVIRVVVGE
jgi:hypothetical protein